MSWRVQFGELPRARKSQVLIVFDNRIPARKGTTVIADSESPEGNMGGANLLTENKSDFYRSDSVLVRSQQATPEIVADYTLATPRDIDWVSHHWSNVHVPWRDDLYRLGSLAGTTGWMHPIVKSEPIDFSYLEFPWTMRPSDERIASMATSMRLQSFAHLAAPVFGVDRIVSRYDVAEGINAGVDFIQIGIKFAGRAFQPTFNMSLGVALAPKDRSEIHRTAGGAAVGITRPTSSELSFVLDNVTDEEGVAQIFTGWVRDEGRLARVFVYMEPAPEKRRHFYDGGAFVGTLTSFDALAIDEEPGEMGDVFVAKNVKAIKIEETE